MMKPNAFYSSLDLVTVHLALCASVKMKIRSNCYCCLPSHQRMVMLGLENLPLSSLSCRMDSTLFRATHCFQSTENCSVSFWCQTHLSYELNKGYSSQLTTRQHSTIWDPRLGFKWESCL
jgi:hypothetical protein